MKKKLFILGLLFSTLSVYAQKPIPDVVFGLGNALKFTAFIKSSGYEAKLRSEEQFTVFVPDDDAVMTGYKANIIKMTTPKTQSDKMLVTSFVKRHIVKGYYDLAAFKKNGSVKNLENQDLKVEVGFRDSKVNNIPILKADVKAKNGMIFTINGCL